MLIDTHCHLHDHEFYTDIQAEEALKRAEANGVERIICIGTNPEDSMAACEFAGKHGNVYWTYGIHPESAKLFFQNGDSIRADSFLQHVKCCKKYPRPKGRTANHSPSQAKTRHVLKKELSQDLVAIGEIGLDYHYGAEDREEQIKLFNEMLQLAQDYNLPVSFHIREAFDDFFGVIANFPNVKGVVHSFSDNKKNLKHILNETDLYIGVNGLATYSTLPTPPLERILLETDAPFLSPVPFRGQSNEPAYIKNIAEWLAAKLETSPARIAEQTAYNADQLFKF